MTPAAAFFVPLILTALASFPLQRQLLRWQMVDIPVVRSSHNRSTVTAGGLAIVLAICSIGIWSAWHTQSQLLLLFHLAVIVGMAVSALDDRKSLPVWVRLIAHLFMASWGVMILMLDQRTTLPWTWRFIDVFCGLLMVLWLAGYSNIFNFMDGINGLAAGQAVITSLGTAMVAMSAGADWLDTPILYCFSVAGAAAGFLPHNFPWARMFMGDAGSIPLGYVLAFLGFWISLEYDSRLFLPLVLLHANFILDGSITLTRRIWRRERWLEAHREHFYQLLARSGRSHASVTVAEMALQLVVLTLMVGYWQASPLLRTVLAAAALGLWLVFFAWCELSFRRKVSQ